MLINNQNLSTLTIAYNAAFKQGFTKAETTYEKVATNVPSKSASNLYPFLGQFPKLREWIGDRHIKNMQAYSYTLVNKDFEATVSVDRNDILDDTYGVYTPLMEELGYAAKRHPDEQVYGKLALGATDLCYDGQPFFDANHPMGGTTYSNYDSTGGGNLWMVMDTRHPLKPMIWQRRADYNFVTLNRPTDENVFMRKEYLYGVDGRGVAGFGFWQFAYGSLNTLNGTNLDAAVTALQSLKGDEGKPLGIKPNLLVVGPSNRVAARDTILKELGTAGESNPNYKELDLHVTQELT